MARPITQQSSRLVQRFFLHSFFVLELPTRRGASSARVSKPSAPTTTASKPKAPAAAAAPASAPVVVQGPGMLATMASSMAGGMAGSVIGHAIVGGVSSMMGGSEPQVAAQDTNMNTVQNDMNNTCNPIYKSFMTCLEKNHNDLASCQWVYDSFVDCKKNGGNNEKTYY
eukprot:gene15960-18974_t